MSLIVYSKSGCKNCKKVKEYFKSQGIPFEERNISSYPDMREKFKQQGIKELPVVFDEETQSVVNIMSAKK